MTGMELIEILRSLLLDPDDGVWPMPIKKAIIDEAMSTIVLLRPDATAEAVEFVLQAHSPKQKIPIGGVRFLDLVRNIGGTGRAIVEFNRKDLGKLMPSWTTIKDTSVEYYMFEEESPLNFWVFPVPLTPVTVELVYSKPHKPFEHDDSWIGLPDIFTAPIIEYVMYRALNMTSAGQNAQKAAFHLQNFYSSMGKKLEGDILMAKVQDQ